MAIDEEAMANDWEKISAKYAVGDDETPPAEPPEKAPAEPEPPAKEAKAGAPGRDETGRFVKAETPPKEEEPAPVKEPPAEPETRGAQKGFRADVTRAPPSWRPAAREGFEKLPENVRAEIHRREIDFTRGQAEILPDAQLGRSMRQTIEPYRMLIEAEGGTPERAVSELLRTAAIFRVGTPQQKWEAFVQVGRQFLGIDLNQANGAQPNPAPQPAQFRDPRVDQLLAREQQRETQGLEGVVGRFMGELDTDGQPKRPYLNDVINDMAALIPQIREANPSLTYEQALEEGYQRAIWAHPEIRQLLQQKAAGDAQAKARTDNLSRVREARRAASVNVPRRASVPGPGKPGTIEETIAQTARELGLIS